MGVHCCLAFMYLMRYLGRSSKISVRLTRKRSSVMKSPSLRPYLALIVGVLAASSSSIFIRFAQNEGASSLLIAAWRVGLATLILTPIVFARYRPILANLQRDQLLLALLAGGALAVHFASWITSLEYTSILISVTLVTTNPLVVALVSPFLLRERLSRVTVGAILLAIIGGIVISAGGGAGSAPKQDAPMLGIVLALIGSVSVAAYFIIGRRLRASIPVVPYIWITYGAAALVLMMLVAINQFPVTGLTSNAYLWMSLTALFPQLIGHSLFNYALGFLRASFVSLGVLGEPIFSTIMAIFLLKEQPTPLQLVGSGLILIALILASREEAQAENSRQAALQTATS